MALGQFETRQPGAATASADAAAVHPQVFSGANRTFGSEAYLRDPLIRDLCGFFERKGLAAIKDEDRGEIWYEDWLAFQSQRKLYARLLSPKSVSTLETEFDLLRYTRFLETIAYQSPAHGYSLQVTFLGLHSVLMGGNAEVKREAVAALEAGGLLAFGVSEKDHGADLLGNEFTLREMDAGRFVANGTKYYIGNSNSASIISILARMEDPRGPAFAKRAPLVLFALRPGASPGFRNERKIRTLGIRAAHVGEFEVKNHELPIADFIAKGRDAWDAVFGTVTLGKFFLGFGSIGICEHAFDEAATHMAGRILYGKPVIDMSHLQMTLLEAYARLSGMKLYAYRALDYVHAGSADDRRFLLYCAVQKARVSTEGVKVMALLSECIGAKGFESDTYFEMALRDILLIPGLESSMHINLKLTAQFIPRYFGDPGTGVASPPSLVGGETPSRENTYLYKYHTGAAENIAFGHFLAAYEPLGRIPNVRIFAQQATAFQGLLRNLGPACLTSPDPRLSLLLGECMATIAYAQLIAENAARLRPPDAIVATVFHTIVVDLSRNALSIASSGLVDSVKPRVLRRMMSVPTTRRADWDFMAARVADTHHADRRVG